MKTRIYIVIISANINNARRCCNNIENMKILSREELSKKIDYETDINNVSYNLIPISDFMEYYNDDVLNVGDSFLSYIQVPITITNF